MPLVVEIILIAIGVVLLALALVGSGISRRLMTIPKMHRVPRIVLAILGVLLLAGGMWGVSTETGSTKHETPSLDELKSHIPPGVKSEMSCTEAAEAPKGAVEANCSTSGTIPDGVWYILFPDVNSMQAYWIRQVGSSDLPGTECTSQADYTKGSKQEYFLDDQSVTVGEMACYVNGSTTGAMYTDRRFNIIVVAQLSDPQHFSEFQTWLGDPSQPVGDTDATPATPSHTAAAGY
ncbi:hypothetical protein [Streptomyces sp. NBC_00459]|uniref:hypothetical protein n=1 Tax=Streptomyces sp. NBC_00459 TaxID=2975749 RepID=UPI002E1759AE